MRRLVALSLLLCFVAAPLLTTIITIIHAEHDCIAEHCTVCAYVHKAQKPAAVILIVSACLFSAIVTRTKIDFLIRCLLITLVSVKVRMNN